MALGIDKLLSTLRPHDPCAQPVNSGCPEACGLTITPLSANILICRPMKYVDPQRPILNSGQDGRACIHPGHAFALHKSSYASWGTTLTRAALLCARRPRNNLEHDLRQPVGSCSGTTASPMPLCSSRHKLWWLLVSFIIVYVIRHGTPVALKNVERPVVLVCLWYP